jgi:hypothetical protein
MNEDYILANKITEITIFIFNQFILKLTSQNNIIIILKYEKL